MPVPSNIIGTLLDMLHPGPQMETPKMPDELSSFITGANTAWDHNWGPNNYQKWMKDKGLSGNRPRQPTPKEGFFLQGAATVISYRKRW